jgi:hypothetical protein
MRWLQNTYICFLFETSPKSLVLNGFNLEVPTQHSLYGHQVTLDDPFPTVDTDAFIH